jgi:hypothetical protein
MKATAKAESTNGPGRWFRRKVEIDPTEFGRCSDYLCVNYLTLMNNIFYIIGVIVVVVVILKFIGLW